MINLVIVESPAKAKTIEGCLGKGYKVLASYGHIRDLPKSKTGVDEETLEPEYIIPTKSRKQVNTLKREVAGSGKVILATDEDREGEAIAWHLVHALQIGGVNKKIENKPFERITFHEITDSAILKAIKNPRQIDQNLVDAQQARRVLDRLVGYKLSPLLWRKIRRGLSAGRVQSAALRLVIEKEQEIRAFKREEYWEIFALLTKEGEEVDSDFQAQLVKQDGKKIEVEKEKEAKGITDYLKKQSFVVDEVIKSEKKINPRPPFTTSTLQQTAAQKLRFSTKKTMVLAQRLYEGVKIPGEGSVGLITYMRTDSLNLSGQTISGAREYVEKEFGREYLPEKPRFYKAKKGAQEAHEAIRPTYIEKSPQKMRKHLDSDQMKLYQLIWKRTIASQMNPEILDLLRVEIGAGKYTLRANGKRVKFMGFSKIYLEDINKEKDVILPKLEKGEKCTLKKIDPQQKFTQPPARYTEASIVKALEENGIGRPSTYAPTISTLKDRRYVALEKRYLIPQEIGFVVNEMLVKHFPEVVDIDFTAKIEKELDEIAEGKTEWKKPIKEFWLPFREKIKNKEDQIKKIDTDIKTDKKCDNCGKMMVIKEGRFGKFYACSGFPDCKNTKPYLEKTGQSCPQCSDGDVILKRTRNGKTFWGCSNYPSCTWASWKDPKDK